MPASPFATAVAADDIRISRADLHAAVVAIFSSLGSDAREAGLMADHLVLANLYGHDSHGISLVPLYVRMVVEGHVKPNQRISTVLDQGTLLTLDAHLGFGQATAHEAIEIGISRAKQNGVVILCLRNSHHIARIGHWAELCAAAGLGSLHFVNVMHGPPVVAPYAGADARLHTNPIAIGLPRSGKPPLILDFATSRVAQGKMRIAMNRGLEVPEGYLIDAEGKPSTDPGIVYRNPLGALLPFGDYKGSGLGFMCDLLAGALSGAGALHEGTITKGVYVNNLFAVIFDPQRLGGRESFEEEIMRGANFVKASPQRDPPNPVLLPGEIERLTAVEREKNGIPIDRTTWANLREAAAMAGADIVDR